MEKVKLSEKYENITIIGDLNINIDPENTDSDNLNAELRDSLLDAFPLAGLKQTVNNCTRQTKDGKPSLIYHSWINNINKHINTTTIDTDSDHDLVLTSLLTRGIIRNEEITKRRDLSKFNKESYLMDLMGRKWSSLYDLKDPTLIDTAITDNILEVLNLHAPIRTFKSGGNKSAGNKKLTKECLSRIRNRNMLRRIAKQTN